MRHHRSRGFTLIELMVAVAISSFLVAAAFALVSHEVRLMGVSDQTLQLTQSTRLALNLISEDLRLAGAGVGYTEGGEFAGIELGSFTRGGATFESNNRAIDLPSGASISDDLGLLYANGNAATIEGYSSAGVLRLCKPPEGNDLFETEEIVLIRSEDGLAARTVEITSAGVDSGCTDSNCLSGCVVYNFSPDTSFESGTGVANVNFSGGSAVGGFRRVTYFLETSDPNDPRRGHLRRVEGDCGALDATCGQRLAENFESMQIRIFQRVDGAWVDITDTGSRPENFDRIRVDLELIARSRTQGDSNMDGVLAALEPDLCFPACGEQDRFKRRVMRVSVEVKNSGRVRFLTAGDSQ